MVVGFVMNPMVEVKHHQTKTNPSLRVYKHLQMLRMYGLFTYIRSKNGYIQLGNVGKYSLHGCFQK